MGTRVQSGLDCLDYVGHLERESARFAAALAQAPPEAPVPTCPEWSADDLWWHLAQVQWFWATIVGQALQEPPPAGGRPERPTSRAELAACFDTVSAQLLEAVAAAAPEDRVWTWSADHTVGFVRRRQAHEALIHRLDAELTVGARGPMDARMGADGVDEALRVMYGRVPDWATFSQEDPRLVGLVAADTGDTWLVGTGRLTGTDPGDGARVDEACVVVAEEGGAEPQASLVGSAADLDCWLWRRPTVAPLERSGDRELLDRLEAVIGPGID